MKNPSLEIFLNCDECFSSKKAHFKNKDGVDNDLSKKAKLDRPILGLWVKSHKLS